MRDLYAQAFLLSRLTGWLAPFFPRLIALPPGVRANARPDAVRPTPKLFTLAQSHLHDGSREHRFMAAAAAAAAVPGDDESTFWPQIQNAVDWLRGRQVLTDRQLSRLISESEVGGLAAADQQRAALNDRLNRAIQDSILTGDSHGSWQQRASQIVDLTARETEAIGRTFTHRAYHEGLREITEEPGIADEFPYVQYMSTHDTRTRATHREMDGKVAHVGSPLAARMRELAAEFNCILPDQKVSGQFCCAVKSFYRGQAVEIVTLGGSKIRVTMKHPILTTDGWVNAGSLREGDKLFRHVVEREVTRDSLPVLELLVGTSQVNHGPSTAEQVFGSFAAFGFKEICRTKAGDFHGEAEFFDGHVDVVWSDERLLRNGESFVSEKTGNVVFKHSLAGHVGVEDLAGPFELGHGAPFKFLGFGRTACFDSMLCESSHQGYARNSDAIRNRLERLSTSIGGDDRINVDLETPAPGWNTKTFEPIADGFRLASMLCSHLMDGQSGLVVLDEIVSKRVIEWCGDVYDLQSLTGVILADDIMMANCRCSIIPLSREDAVAAGIDDNTGWVEQEAAKPVPEPKPEPSPTKNLAGMFDDDGEGISLLPEFSATPAISTPAPPKPQPGKFIEEFLTPTQAPAQESAQPKPELKTEPKPKPEKPAKTKPAKAKPTKPPAVKPAEVAAPPMPSITPSKKPKSGWPDPGDLSPVKSLGGATGAKLVKDSSDVLYVQKSGSNAAHVTEESIADALYAKAGVKVPAAKLFTDGSGKPVKLAKFIEGQTLAEFSKTATQKQIDAVHKQLQKDFAIDALLGNRDVIGTNPATGGYDNILVDTKGKAWRIDNGGALRFGGLGQAKSASNWGAEVKEFDGLRNPSLNPQAAKVFGSMSNQDLVDSIDRAIQKRAAILQAAPVNVKDVLQKRFDWLSGKRAELIEKEAKEAAKTIAAKPKATPSASEPKPKSATAPKPTPVLVPPVPVPAPVPKPKPTIKPTPTPAAKVTNDGVETKSAVPASILNNDLLKSRERTHTQITDLHHSLAVAQKSITQKMTMEQKQAIKDYAYSDFATINGVLRGQVTPDSFSGPKTKAIQEAIASAGKLEKPIITYRGMAGEKASAMKEKLVQAIQDNVPVKLSGITSSSIDPEIAAGFGAAQAGDGIIFEIQPATGMYISGMHGVEPTPAQEAKGEYMFTLAYGTKEREFLQNHNTHYKIKKIRTQVPVSEFIGGNYKNDTRKVTVVQMIEIDPGDPKAYQLANRPSGEVHYG